MGWFAPPRPPGKRYKILLWGESGVLKTLSALSFPRCAHIDNHGSAENYQAAYPEHLFFPPPGIRASFDNQKSAVMELLGNPGDRLTCVIDDMTTIWDQIQALWSDRFLARLPRSKGHHAEFYTFQPSDWIHPKRDNRHFIRLLLALDMNVIVIARAKKEYAGASGDSDFMKVVGQIFAGEPNLIYEFDYAFKLLKEDGKFFAEISQKQRVPVGGKPFPERFDFGVDTEGKSTFFQVFSQYANVTHFNTPAKAVEMPQEEFPVEEKGQGQVEGEKPVGDQVAVPAAGTDNPKTPATTATGEPTVQGTPTPITPAKLDKLVELKAHYNIQKPEWDKTLTKLYNVTTARALTEAQGEHFINYLETQRVPF